MRSSRTGEDGAWSLLGTMEADPEGGGGRWQATIVEEACDGGITRMMN